MIKQKEVFMKKFNIGLISYSLIMSNLYGQLQIIPPINLTPAQIDIKDPMPIDSLELNTSLDTSIQIDKECKNDKKEFSPFTKNWIIRPLKWIGGLGATFLMGATYSINNSAPAPSEDLMPTALDKAKNMNKKLKKINKDLSEIRQNIDT
jgi:hypothetical protein